MKISFAIIGHNEAEFLEDCLRSIKDIAYEIIYVDCESIDNSLDVAKRFNAIIFHRKNDLNLNINKQFAIDKCNGDWIFYIDPDERLTDELKIEIKQKLINTENVGFLIKRKNFYFGKHLKYGGKYPDKQLRLFRRGYGFFECKSIHERIKINGKISEMKNPFIHIVIKDTSHLIRKIDSYRIITPAEHLRLNKTINVIIFRSVRKFFINYFLKLGFIDGAVGFFVALIDLFNGVLAYFELINKKQK